MDEMDHICNRARMSWKKQSLAEELCNKAILNVYQFCSWMQLVKLWSCGENFAFVLIFSVH